MEAGKYNLARKKKYEVCLSRTQRNNLERAFRGGKAPVLELRRKQILLLADINGPNHSDKRIAAALGCTVMTVLNVRKRFCERGFNGAITRKEQERPSRTPILDGYGEARLIALACEKAPEGSARWSLRLLAKRAVELKIADDISYETVRRVLKKRTQAPLKATMVYSSRGGRRVRGCNGRRSGSLLPVSQS